MQSNKNQIQDSLCFHYVMCKKELVYDDLFNNQIITKRILVPAYESNVFVLPGVSLIFGTQKKNHPKTWALFKENKIIELKWFTFLIGTKEFMVLQLLHKINQWAFVITHYLLRNGFFSMSLMN